MKIKMIKIAVILTAITLVFSVCNNPAQSGNGNRPEPEMLYFYPAEVVLTGNVLAVDVEIRGTARGGFQIVGGEEELPPEVNISIDQNNAVIRFWVDCPELTGNEIFTEYPVEIKIWRQGIIKTFPVSVNVRPMRLHIMDFFLERLSNLAKFSDEMPAFIIDTPTSFNIEDLETYRALVWNAWREANSEFTEERLIPLIPLNTNPAPQGQWTIPPVFTGPQYPSPHFDVVHYHWGSKGTRPASGFPMFIYLHGSGPQATEWAAGLTLSRQFQDAPSVYFIPRSFNPAEQRWHWQPNQFVWEKLLRQVLLGDIVDPNKIFFTGISEGGYGSQRLGAFYADYLAGAGPMAGGEPLINAPVENFRNTAFTLRTGANDTGFGRNQLTGIAADAFGALEAKYPGDFIHWIHLIPGAGHGIDYNPTTPWLRGHTRNPHPRRVSWENFEMDNRYRAGFHNIRVIERSNPNFSSRTHYELVIDGNNITLDVSLVTYTETSRHPSGQPLTFDRSYTPATTGIVKIYLSPDLVNLEEPISVTVNGVRTFEDYVTLDIRHLVESCALFFDPFRLFPAAVVIDLEDL